MRKKKENCGTNITKDTILNSETKNKPQEKDKEKVICYTWTKRFGWRVNGFIKTENKNERDRK